MDTTQLTTHYGPGDDGEEGVSDEGVYICVEGVGDEGVYI